MEVLAAQAVMIPVALLAGWLGEIWGRKPVFAIGFIGLSPAQGVNNDRRGGAAFNGKPDMIFTFTSSGNARLRLLSRRASLILV